MLSAAILCMVRLSRILSQGKGAIENSHMIRTTLRVRCVVSLFCYIVPIQKIMNMYIINQRFNPSSELLNYTDIRNHWLRKRLKQKQINLEKQNQFIRNKICCLYICF